MTHAWQTKQGQYTDFFSCFFGLHGWVLHVTFHSQIFLKVNFNSFPWTFACTHCNLMQYSYPLLHAAGPCWKPTSVPLLFPANPPGAYNIFESDAFDISSVLEANERSSLFAAKFPGACYTSTLDTSSMHRAAIFAERDILSKAELQSNAIHLLPPWLPVFRTDYPSRMKTQNTCLKPFGAHTISSFPQNWLSLSDQDICHLSKSLRISHHFFFSSELTTSTPCCSPNRDWAMISSNSRMNSSKPCACCESWHDTLINKQKIFPSLSRTFRPACPGEKYDQDKVLIYTGPCSRWVRIRKFWLLVQTACQKRHAGVHARVLLRCGQDSCKFGESRYFHVMENMTITIQGRSRDLQGSTSRPNLPEDVNDIILSEQTMTSRVLLYSQTGHCFPW